MIQFQILVCHLHTLSPPIPPSLPPPYQSSLLPPSLPPPSLLPPSLPPLSVSLPLPYDGSKTDQIPNQWEYHQMISFQAEEKTITKIINVCLFVCHIDTYF